MTRTTSKARWVQLIAGTIVLLFAGIIYAWSILKTPLGDAFGWTAGQLGLNYTFAVSFFCIGGFISGLISKKTTPKMRMLMAAVLFFAAFFITSRLQGSVVVLYLSYGVLGGTSIGFVYNTIIAGVNAWFPDKRGLASGVMLMSFGLNSLIVGKLADICIKSPAIGWRPTFLALAVITAAVFAAAAFIIKMPSAGMVLPQSAGAAKSDEQSVGTRDYTAREMLGRLSFWKLFVFFLLLASVGSAAISFAKDIMQDVRASEALAVVMVGVLSVSNGLGRLVSGWLFDNIGCRKTQYVTSILAIAAPLLVVLAIQTNSLAIGVIGLCLCGVTYGFAPTGSTAFIGVFFGQKNFSLNLSILNLQLVLTSFAATLAGVLKDATGSFQSIFIILAAFSVAGLFLNLSIKKP